MHSDRTSVVLLTRAGCHSCEAAWATLTALCARHGVTPTSIDVDEAAATIPDLRAEYGDRVPVVLLDDREHSYWEVDEPRLSADLASRGHPKNV